MSGRSFPVRPKAVSTVEERFYLRFIEDMWNIPGAFAGHGYGNHGGCNHSAHRPAAGGAVNVVYFCEEDNTVWANGVIWAAGLVDGKGNVNSSELTNVPEGYKLKEVGDFYYEGGSELRIQIVP